MRGTRLLLISLTVCTMALAGDKDFDQIVNAIEKHYGTTRNHIPLMGIANLFMKVRHPEGISGFKIATFENLDVRADDSDFLNTFSPGDLHRMVRVRSQPDGESTYIYAADVSKSTRVLVVTLQRNEATVVEVKASISALVKLLGDPAHMGSILTPAAE